MYYNRGTWYFDEENWDAAIADYTRAIELGANDDALSGYYLQRGLAYYYKGDSNKAIQDFNSALSRVARSDIDNLDAIAHYSRGLAFEQKRDWTSAMTDYTAAIQVDPKAIKAYLRRGMLHYRRGDATRSIADLSRVLKLDPDNAQALLERARVYTRLEDYNRALPDINRGIRITNDPVFYLARAWVTVATGHRAQAIKDLRYVITHTRDPKLRETA
jgi:tetratricopeptide (TPR) repeat protein